MRVKLKSLVLFIIFLLGWFAVSTQLVLMLSNKKADVGETIIRFFSFFTILTNLLVAIFASLKLFAKNDRFTSWLLNYRAETAITLYIVIVGLIYNIILRSIWNPTGLQKVADELLHTVIPLLFLGYWIAFVDKKLLVYKDIFLWLIYPAVYCLFVLFRGYFSNFYPYPFIDVNVLGYTQTAINSFFLILVFIAFSLCFVVTGKLSARR